MRKFVIFATLSALMLAACARVPTPPGPNAAVPTSASDPIPTIEARTLTVFAAASLTGAFGELGKNFEAAHPGVTVRLNFAGSQALRTQIEQGAAADVFASASKTEMSTLMDPDKLVAADAPQVFLTNKLIVLLPADNPAGLAQLQDLARPGLKLVLAAEDVPVGRYARQAFDQMNGTFGGDYKDKVLANVVSNEEDVKQVVAKVQLGEADAGVVYTSDAIAAPQLKTIVIPDDVNIIAQYPIAPLVKSANPELAGDFIAYVLSSDGQAVLSQWGFLPAAK